MILTVILLPLRPASLMNKNPQRSKINHGMHPVRRKDQSINLNIFVVISAPLCNSFGRFFAVV